MKLLYPVAIGLCIAASCRPEEDLVTPLPSDTACEEDIGLTASTAEKTRSDGSVAVFGTVNARDGVTVRSLYVAESPVAAKEFNYRVWDVTVPADQVAAHTRQGVATLAVIAYTSTGCATLKPPLKITVEEGTAGGGAGGEGGTNAGTGGQGQSGGGQGAIGGQPGTGGAAAGGTGGAGGSSGAPGPGDAGTSGTAMGGQGG